MDIYSRLKTTFSSRSPRLYAELDKRKLIVKYLVAGSAATGTDLLLLYFFTDLIGIHYLASSILAFLLAIGVSFGLQKYWTFRDGSKQVKSQFFYYLLSGLSGLLLNTLFMYFQVDLLRVWYLLAQIITSALIAVINFLVYRFLIFKKVQA